MDTQPVYQYKDESFSRKQTLTLSTHRIHVKGKVFFHGEYEASFGLENISPHFQAVTVRHNSFWWFFAMLLITLGISIVFHGIPGTTVDTTTGGLLTVFPLFPFVACLVTFRKVRMVQFVSHQGQPLFALIRGGKEKDNFQEVVSHIVRNIESYGT